MASYPRWMWRLEGSHVNIGLDTFTCWPFLTSVATGNLLNTAITDVISQWDYVIVPWGSSMRTDISARLRAKNPGVKVLQWMSLGQVYSGLSSDSANDPRFRAVTAIEALGNAVGGRLKCYVWSADYPGFKFDPEVASGGGNAYSNFGFNFYHADVVTAYVNALVTYITSTGTYDGIFFDYAYADKTFASRINASQNLAHQDGPTPARNDCIDYTQEGLTLSSADAATWNTTYLAGYRSFWSQLRAGAPNAIFLANTGGTLDATARSQINGIMVEGFPTQGGSQGGDTDATRWQKNMFGTGSFVGMLNAETLTAAPRLNGISSTPGSVGFSNTLWTPDGAPGTGAIQQLRYQAASCMLSDTLMFDFSGGPPDQTWTKRLVEMGVDTSSGIAYPSDPARANWLGAPLGPYTVDGMGFYYRYFEHGAVFVNPLGFSNTISPGLTPKGNAFRRIQSSGYTGDTVNIGGVVTTYVLPAYDAIFLVGDPPSSQPSGTQTGSMTFPWNQVTSLVQDWNPTESR